MPARLEPPIGVPGVSTTPDDKGWASLVATQLETARKSAENWRNGLIGLIGVIAAFSAIKGPAEIAGLDHAASYGVGVLLLLALVSACIGTVASLTAAYGSPVVVTREEFHRRGGVIGNSLHLAKQVLTHLRIAKVATAAALLLLVCAVGLTWYGPRPTKATLEVVRETLPTVCGVLLPSGRGYLDIRTPASNVIRINTAEIKETRAAAICK